MPRRTSSGRIVHLAIDSDSDVPIYQQVYTGIRQRILEGRLPAGGGLPSTRALARDLCVSRSTVIQAYEQLRLEGYAQGRVGAATRVAVSLPDRSLRAPAGGFTPRRAAVHPGRASARALEVTALNTRSPDLMDEAPRAFRAGVPAVDIFPVDTWGRLMARRWRMVQAKSLSYGRPFGFLPLRQALTEYLGSARGVRCDPEQVLIVNGSQQGLDLAARVLLDPGDKVWLEDPGYNGARGAFAAAGASGVAVPVDEEGLVVREGRRLAPDARVAFVTPSRQLPLGVALSLARRLELLEWAGGSGSWIFEDDYDSEFRYVGRPLGALHGLDAHGCVIYAGTFSKVTFPSVRLGYLVVPPALVDVFAAVRSFADFSPPWLTQAVMTDFMTGGHFERHIRRMRALYKERQDTLVAQGRRELAGVLDIQPSDAGMTLLAWLPPGVSDVAAAAAAREHRVDVLPLSSFCGRSIRPGLLLGYAGVREREIKDATVRLAQALEPFRHRRSA
ncbi:MAG TPA: PLP-dependent aminotransferase family protein [Gemmatimonadales bacterium]|nr:PLP-dependent aminotransferase family protein [Gemmatimonadales bacterium]